jgi:tripartite ATP-independent transporter DctP family solute receptor
MKSSKPPKAASLLAILIFPCLFSPAAAAESLNLRAADTQPAGYPTVLAVEFIAEQLAIQSDDRIKLKTYSGGQLGDEKATLEITIFGGIDLNRVSLGPLNSIVPETGVFSLPFLFRSTEHMRHVLDGPIGKEILASLEPYGLVGLAFYDAGARSMYNSKQPIRSPADMKGMKIRVMNSSIFVDMMAALGANATPMGPGQVYESLALGTIDGAENNWPTYSASGHFEVAPHYSVTQHVMVPEVLVMSRYRWEKVPSKDQVLIRKLAAESVIVERRLWDERVTEAHAAMLAAGVSIVDEIDKRPFMDAMDPLYDQYLKKPELRKLVERIRATE